MSHAAREISKKKKLTLNVNYSRDVNYTLGSERCSFKKAGANSADDKEGNRCLVEFCRDGGASDNYI